MRRILRSLGVLVAFGVVGSVASAQAPVPTTGDFNDPFFLYYGYYLPYQNFRASIPRQEDLLRQQAAQQQFNAMTERATLWDPAAAADPLAAYGGASATRLPPVVPTGMRSTHLNGSGPIGYYNRSNNYYPGMRTGRGGVGGMGGIRSSPIGSGGMGAYSGLSRGRGVGRGIGMGGMGMGGFGGGRR
jgi:hypothetical protein